MKDRFHMEQPQNLMAKKVIGLAMRVYNTLGCGFVESIYQNALIIELKKANIFFSCQPKIAVMYEGAEVGVFQADLIIEDQLIVELKAVDALHTEHSLQLINYLTATKIEEGLLINFGAPSLEFRTKTRVYLQKPRPLDPPNLQS